MNILKFENFLTEKIKITKSRFSEFEDTKDDFEEKISKERKNLEKAKESGDEKLLKLSALKLKKLELKRALAEVEFKIESLS
jgi:phosphatidate phosphatase PAH1